MLSKYLSRYSSELSLLLRRPDLSGSKLVGTVGLDPRHSHGGKAGNEAVSGKDVSHEWLGGFTTEFLGGANPTSREALLACDPGCSMLALPGFLGVFAVLT